MKVFFAGASGVIGRSALPLLLSGGHEVVGTASGVDGCAVITSLGAQAVPWSSRSQPVDDLVDLVRAAQPDVVVTAVTDLKRLTGFGRLDRSLASTNALRERVTAALVRSAATSGAHVVAASVAGWFSEGRTGRGPAPLLSGPPHDARETVAALRHLEEAVAVLGSHGTVLRFGALYGPGTSLGKGGSVLEDVAARRVPLVGSAGGMWSFCHVEDAGRAVALAVTERPGGTYEIVDDDPVPVREWLPELARLVDAPAPRRVPRWVVRLTVGPFAAHVMTAARGGSNVTARDVGFVPRYASWRDGFAEAL
ncbi:nucleoside-diphosphate-sugar epimerase [Mumia flava]|uniref:Nucleoside-diphosphate-sugar epimerase n=1 Tax=Mumia flava TaxID=1348852 RepID=A0A0B2BAP5_9ACTN|nr:NAD-dependent epimerase/dehydratase family protein [Mumia flava]PJJ53816.1 nucleoside-diphosphate-sugar epimerase [Mumia flava]